MSKLTLEAIDENPSNVISHSIPAVPSKLLLLTAQIAATCLQQVAGEILAELGMVSKNLGDVTNTVTPWISGHWRIGRLEKYADFSTSFTISIFLISGSAWMSHEKNRCSKNAEHSSDKLVDRRWGLKVIDGNGWKVPRVAIEVRELKR